MNLPRALQTLLLLLATWVWHSSLVPGEPAATLVVQGVSCELSMDWLHVVSGIRLRFATTHIRARISNNGNASAAYAYKQLLPESAFLTNFTMSVSPPLMPWCGGRVEEWKGVGIGVRWGA